MHSSPRSRLNRQPLARLLVVGAMFVALAACAVRLAPAYDETIVKGLEARYVKLEEFFVAIETSAPSDVTARAYTTHESFYRETLTDLRRLALLARSRPQPQGDVTSWLGLGAEPDPETGAVPRAGNLSGEMFDRLIGNVDMMRTGHASFGIEADDVPDLRGTLGTQFEAILSYEKFLERD